jgi:hypothetical protein
MIGAATNLLAKGFEITSYTTWDTPTVTTGKLYLEPFTHSSPLGVASVLVICAMCMFAAYKVMNLGFCVKAAPKVPKDIKLRAGRKAGFTLPRTYRD